MFTFKHKQGITQMNIEQHFIINGFFAVCFKLALISGTLEIILHGLKRYGVLDALLGMIK